MNIKDYIRLYFHMVKYNIMAQMEYKVNFLLSVFTEVGFLLAKSLYIIVVFSIGLSINGATPDQILMFIGSYTIITGIMDSVYYPNIASIPSYVQNGELDIYLTKPVSCQFLCSFRKFDIGLGIPNVLAGVIMVVISWGRTGTDVSIINIVGYICFTLVGCIVTYPLLIIPTILAFRLIRVDALQNIIFALWDFNNMPMAIYHKNMQRIGVFLIPIFLITNFAPMFVFGILPKAYMLYSIVAIPLFVWISILLWNKAIKNYSSASS
ncbi:ABC transporter permease [[Clostridium] polysaccharolyticum]|uniref:ABC-2 type transport system permease protein n=1 Tax=[Clostridium] polysaccharolyticum TaxID=29364 RepID=A0A1H9Y5M2_9FIRM|nr:ABC-2 family transporter protein [[Clostridium] polysaccharolyticum]SES64179.1 ABC-2 type transport system permease protein [[Clostridium] polysaccharolyticum]